MGTEPWPLDPLDTVERRESVCLATLRMLEQLTPPERAVFVLHEAFDEHGKLKSPSFQKQVDGVAQELVRILAKLHA